MSTPNPSSSTDLRLAVRHDRPRLPLDGAWWPRSDDLAVEVGVLVDHFPVELGRIMRVLYSTPDWRAPVRRAGTTRGSVKLGTFPDDDTHLLVALMSDHTRRHLLVIPPGTPAAIAESLMDAATSDHNAHSAVRLLEDAGLPLPNPA